MGPSVTRSAPSCNEVECLAVRVCLLYVALYLILLVPYKNCTFQTYSMEIYDQNIYFADLTPRAKCFLPAFEKVLQLWIRDIHRWTPQTSLRLRWMFGLS
eukprot:Rmarinus@m.30208